MRETRSVRALYDCGRRMAEERARTILDAVVEMVHRALQQRVERVQSCRRQCISGRKEYNVPRSF